MTNTLTLDQLQDRYTDGVYCADHGCFYFVDYDSELGYFIESATNGVFFPETEYVDYDLLEEDVKEVIDNVRYAITTK